MLNIVNMNQLYLCKPAEVIKTLYSATSGTVLFCSKGANSGILKIDNIHDETVCYETAEYCSQYEDIYMEQIAYNSDGEAAEVCMLAYQIKKAKSSDNSPEEHYHVAHDILNALQSDKYVHAPEPTYWLVTSKDVWIIYGLANVMHIAGKDPKKREAAIKWIKHIREQIRCGLNKILFDYRISAVDLDDKIPFPNAFYQIDGAINTKASDISNNFGVSGESDIATQPIYYRYVYFTSCTSKTWSIQELCLYRNIKSSTINNMETACRNRMDFIREYIKTSKGKLFISGCMAEYWRACAVLDMTDNQIQQELRLLATAAGEMYDPKIYINFKPTKKSLSLNKNFTMALGLTLEEAKNMGFVFCDEQAKKARRAEADRRRYASKANPTKWKEVMDRGRQIIELEQTGKGKVAIMAELSEFTGQNITPKMYKYARDKYLKSINNGVD